MERDPIRLNYYHGTGAYAWQLAEYMQSSVGGSITNVQLDKPAPPRLRTPLAPFPIKLSASSVVRWAVGVSVTHNVPRLIGARGFRCSMAVSAAAEAFGEFEPEIARALLVGISVGSLSKLELNGHDYTADTILVTLVRHGLVDTNQDFVRGPPTAYVKEPTCIVTESSASGLVASNQLTGRSIRISDASFEVFNSSERPKPIDAPLKGDFVRFFEAGMIRPMLDGQQL